MTLSDFARDVNFKIAAGYQALAVSTRERIRVLEMMADLAAAENRPLVGWLPAEGFRLLWPDDERSAIYRAIRESWLPPINETAYIGDLHAALSAVIDEPTFPADAIFLFFDAHELLAAQTDVGAIMRSNLLSAIDNTRINARGRHERPLLFVHPAEKIHPDVDSKLEPVRLPLLSAAEIADRVVSKLEESLVVDETGQRQPNVVTGLEGAVGDALRQQLGAACGGLLVGQASNVLAECLVRHGRFRAEMVDDVHRYRADLINASGLLTVYSGTESFDDVGGLAALKQFLLRIARPLPAGTRARPRGVLLMGVPGCGKTLIARAAANETGRLPIQLDIGALMGGVVGQTESQLRRALEIIDGSGPAIVLIDEVDKSLSGVKSSGSTDGGVMSRVFGALLTWLNDHTSDAIVVVTCNDHAGLPPEFARTERFDASFYVDLPRPQDRDILWHYYVAKYGLSQQQTYPAGVDWSGADIATCARLSALLEVPLIAAAENVVPLAVTRKEDIEALRTAASTRFLDADLGGRYTFERRSAESKTSAAPGVRTLRKHSSPNDPTLN